MIQITMSFTTIALAAAAMAQLNGSQLAAATVVDTAPAATKVPAVEKPKAEKPAAAVPTVAAVTTTPTATVVPTPVAAASTTQPDAVDYVTLQKAVFALVGTVKAAGLDTTEHVLGIAKSFGFENFAAMKAAGPVGASFYTKALAAVTAKAAELAELAVA